MPHMNRPDFQKLAACQVFAQGRRLCYIGRMDAVAAHEHATTAWLFGLDGPFRIAMANGSNAVCRSAIVPAGLLHRLAVGYGRLGVVYLDPMADQPCATGKRSTPRLPHPGEAGFLDVLGRLASGQAREEEFWQLLDYSLKKRRAIDGRLLHVLGQIEARVDFNLPLAELADGIQLSPSRLVHLMHQELGVSLRRYRLMERMRRSVLAIHGGRNLTETALDLGFSTPSHFSTSFRNMFGVTPSAALLRQR